MYRRICEMSFAVSFFIILLYVWSNFLSTENTVFKISIIPVALSTAVIILSIIGRFWLSVRKKRFISALVIYIMVLSSLAVLITQTGGTSSPYIAVWLVATIFSGIFSYIGSFVIALPIAVFTALQYINHNLTTDLLLMIIFGGLAPIIVSLIIWREKSKNDDETINSRTFKNIASELNEVANKSEVVINAIGDGVMAIDNKGVIQLINPAAQSIIGWTKQDAMGLNYKSVMQLLGQKDEPVDPAHDPIQQSLNVNQQIRTNSITLLTKNSKKITIAIVASPVSEVGSGVIIVFRDVTKEKAEEHEQAEFISTASHEMRTPVASIEGYLGLALNPQTAQIDNRAKDFILKAQASAQHLGHLFQDLLDVSKADDGRIANNPRVVNIVDLVGDITQGLASKATAKGLQLHFKPMPDSNNREKSLAPVFFVNQDNDHIREIVDNLVENAIKYTLKGQIVVDATGDDDRVVISVKDNGIGIPAEDIPHLFQKFYRVDDKDTRSIGGTGLGLYLCRRLAEIMGGRIWVESIYGSGSTFYFELPRIDSQEAARLIEQEHFKAQQESSQAALMGSTPKEDTNTFTPQNTPASSPTSPISPTQQSAIQTQPVPAKTSHNVPRGQALTPEQIASYVAKQRELASQQNTVQNPTRPQSIAVPTRNQPIQSNRQT